jgi:hypothetical protein
MSFSCSEITARRSYVFLLSETTLAESYVFLFFRNNLGGSVCLSLLRSLQQNASCLPRLRNILRRTDGFWPSSKISYRAVHVAGLSSFFETCDEQFHGPEMSKCTECQVMCGSGVGFADVSKSMHQEVMDWTSSNVLLENLCGVLDLELLYFENYER